MDGGYGDKVDAGTLRNILWSERRRLSLVVLNACNSATAGRDVYGNTARTLAVNIPAVIGMQYPFSSRAAETFSESFYRAVADRFSIQAALRQARLMLQATGPEWITPVLYLGGNDGILVR
jgi:CHAT domain-containing protein